MKVKMEYDSSKYYLKSTKVTVHVFSIHSSSIKKKSAPVTVLGRVLGVHKMDYIFVFL